MSTMRWLVALLAALLILTGCEEGSEDSGGSSDAAATSEPTDETEGSDETDGSEETDETDGSEGSDSTEGGGEVALPEGHQWVEADASGVRFAAPAEWIIASAEVLNNPGSQAQLEELAERSGQPASAWQEVLKNMDVLVMSPAGEAINVQPPGILAALPAEATIRAQFETLDATVTAVDDVETAVGPGVVAFYHITLTNGREQYGTSLFVETDNGIVNITGTMWDADSATKLTGTASATLSYIE